MRKSILCLSSLLLSLTSPGADAKIPVPSHSLKGVIWPAQARPSIPTGPGWAAGTLRPGKQQAIALSDQQGLAFEAFYTTKGQPRPLEQTLMGTCSPIGSVKTTPVLLAGPLTGNWPDTQVKLTWNNGGGSTLQDGERQRFWMWVYSPTGGRMIGTWRCGDEELLATLVLPANRWTEVTLSRFIPSKGLTTSTLQMNQGPGTGVWTPERIGPSAPR